MNKLVITILFSISGIYATGQSFDNYMEKVRLAHPDIIAARQLLASDEAFSITGITPDDPRISLGYFPGNEPAPGDKITWGISQSFDFPTRYSRIKSLKQSNLELAKMEYSLTYIYILSEARSTAIEYLSLHERLEILKTRLETMKRLENAYSILLENGEATLVEFNKVRIKHVELISDVASSKNKLDILKTRLDFMSGNSSEELLKSSYPDIIEPEMPGYLDRLKSSHPAFQLPLLRTLSANNEVKVTRADNLPSFDIAYSSEIVADQRFTGPSIGVSVPLWNNKGKVKKSVADSDYQIKRAESDLLYQESIYTGYYRSYLANKENLAIIDDALRNSNNTRLIDITLDKGEISLTEYLIELGSIYELVDMQLLLKKENYILLSKLNELDFSSK